MESDELQGLVGFRYVEACESYESSPPPFFFFFQFMICFCINDIIVITAMPLILVINSKQCNTNTCNFQFIAEKVGQVWS